MSDKETELLIEGETDINQDFEAYNGLDIHIKSGDNIELEDKELSEDKELVYGNELNEKKKLNEEKELNEFKDIDNKNEQLNPNKKIIKKNKLLAILMDIVLYAVIFYVCLYIIPTYVVQKTIVDGESMENTLHNEEHLMVEKVSIRFTDLNRFDVIVFYPYGREQEEEYYVKRIIGLPGEIIQIIGSDIYINGEVLKEDYGKDPIRFAGWAEEPITIGEDEYFVMGDNREISFDSRYEEIGLVSKENIGGRAVLRIWPLNKFGLIND